MKRAFFRKPRAYSIFLIGAILFLGVLAFYLSCTSKSPTDVAAPSAEILAAKSTKGTTQTTTSSSTTTTIRPSSSAAASSTIITSRFLTTTSITTTTIPGVTTTVIQPANVKFCYIIGVYKNMQVEFDTLSANGVPPAMPKKVTIYNGDTVYVPYPYCLSLNFYVHNVGGSPAENVKIIPLNLGPASQNIYRGASNFIELPEIALLPNASVCVKHPLSSWFQCGAPPVNTRTAQTVAPCMTWKFKLEWKDARWESKFSFIMCWGFPNNSVPS